MTTNPNTIPDEIMKVARDIAASRYIGSQWSHMREYFADGLYDNDPVVISASKAIHDAVMAEREKKADLIAALQLADQFLSHLKNSWEVCGHTQAMIDQIKAALAAHSAPADTKAEG